MSLSATPRDPTDRPQIRDDVVFRQLKHEWVVLDPVADRVHVLNLTAALVWTACDGTSTLEEIADQVHDAFEGRVEHASVRTDVEAALANLRSEGLLQ